MNMFKPVSKKEMGAVIQEVMKRTNGRADGKKISQIVSQKIKDLENQS